jgi:predicted  nucleic acid-binding Zn-ribbon protein
MNSFDDECKLLKLRKVQIEAELENLNVRIKDLTKKSDELLKEMKK